MVSFEVIVDAYRQIGEHMPLLEQYKDFFSANTHMRHVLALIYADILMFQGRAIRLFTGRGTCLLLLLHLYITLTVLQHGGKYFLRSGKTFNLDSHKFWRVSAVTVN
jgi:hypothetical protein